MTVAASVMGVRRPGTGVTKPAGVERGFILGRILGKSSRVLNFLAGGVGDSELVTVGAVGVLAEGVPIVELPMDMGIPEGGEATWRGFC